MGFIQDLKNSKQKQNEFLDRIATMPKLVNAAVTLINVSSRIVAPFFAVYNLIAHTRRQQTIVLDSDIRSHLEDKRNTYMSLMKEKADSYGFIEHECCDSLLFTGLVGAVGWKTVIEKARDKDGRWHRRDTDRSCYPHGSRSTISRDMLLGLFWYIWRNRRLDLAMDLWQYGKKHNWIMGEGDVSRIYLTPGMQATLAEIIYQLGGDNYWVTRNLPMMWAKGLEGYQCHLEVLHILLRGELKRNITSSMWDALIEMSSRCSDNHLYVAACARYASEQQSVDVFGKSVALGLLNADMWPGDRLPTDADRSSRWIFENNDWSKGSDKTEIHTGGDLIFCASLLLEYSYPAL